MANSKNRPVSTASVKGSKRPVVIEDTGSFYRNRPSWRFSLSDTDHDRWSVLDSIDDVIEDKNDPTGTKVIHTFSKSIDAYLLQCLKDRESMPWSEIMSQTGGRGKKGGTNSHYIYIHELTKEAQKRAKELDIDSDQLFSLRVEAKKRVWGVLEDGVLEIIWFDRDHEVCPISK